MALRFWIGPGGGIEPQPSLAKTPPRFVVARRAELIAAATLLVDLTMVVLAYAVARAIKSDRLLDLPTDPRVNATIPFWLAVFFAYGLYGRKQILEPALKITGILGAVTTSTLLTIVITFAFGLQLSREWTVALWLASIGLVLAGRVGLFQVTHLLNRAHWLGLRTLVVGVNAEARTLARVLAKKRHLGYEVLGFIGLIEGPVDQLPVVGTMDELRQKVMDFDIGAIFIAGSGAGPDVLNQIDRSLDGLGVRIRTSLGIPHLAASRVVVQAVDGMAMLAVQRTQPSEFDLRMKRAMDVALSLIGLVLGLPFVIAIAIAIKLTDGGKIIFAQKRVGADGARFTMYKFRTMVSAAESMRTQLMHINEADGALFKMRRDPRVTRVGRRLRQLGLDELPQLVNVFLGEMSLVGPRPALPDEMASWSPELAVRLKAKPGLTGLWQVSGRHELAFEDYVRYDLFYVENWSLRLDLQIIARTIPALLSRAGAF